jgi:hypothetical protein
MVPAAAHRTQRRLLAAALAAGLVAHSAALQLPLQPRSWLLQPPEEAAAAGASPSLGTTAAAAAAGARGSSVPAAADADAAQQCFSWSWTHSIAGGTFAYPPNDAQGDENAASRLAQAGAPRRSAGTAGDTTVPRYVPPLTQHHARRPPPPAQATSSRCSATA